MRPPLPLLALIAALLAPGPGQAGERSRKTPRPLEVHPASELPQLLGQLAHGRPLVLHLCATWCESCRVELQSLHKLLHGLERRGVSLALAWVDDPETRAAIPATARRDRVSDLPAIILDAPEPAPVAAALGEPQWDGSLPATFVYDVHQHKVKAFLGQADGPLLDAAIRRALEPSAGK